MTLDKGLVAAVAKCLLAAEETTGGGHLERTRGMMTKRSEPNSLAPKMHVPYQRALRFLKSKV
jgi:hypothetical protein